MHFALPVPRYWRSPGITVADWIYLAGGKISNRGEVISFEKINMTTGEVIKFKELRRPSYDCQLIKW